MAGIENLRQGGELPLDVSGLRLAEPVEEKAVLHSATPIHVQNEAKGAPSGCFPEGMQAMRRKKCDRPRSGFIGSSIRRDHPGPAQVTQDLGEGVAVFGELVHLGQVTVHAQAPHPEARKPDVYLLQKQGTVIFHDNYRKTAMRRKESRFCAINASSCHNCPLWFRVNFLL